MATSDTARTPSLAAGTSGVCWNMALDVDRCIGCHACSVACKVENKVPLGRFRTQVCYCDTGRFSKTQRCFLSTLCMPGEDAPCPKSYPEDAIFKSADGIVKINPDRCTHERKCEAACPYGAIGCDGNDVAERCSFCFAPHPRPRKCPAAMA